MCLFLKRENLDTDTHIGRAPFEDEGRVWSDGSKVRMPEMASKPPGAGERRHGPDSSSQLSEVPNPDSHVHLLINIPAPFNNNNNTHSSLI